MSMSLTDSERLKLNGSSAIHVGPIVTSGSNETISIVIPLSAQVATLGGQMSSSEARGGGPCNDCGKDFVPATAMPGPDVLERRRAVDNSRGCPFPTCSRYGRAFSRAHDLKRHIARHEAKKERLFDGPDFHGYPSSEAALRKYSQIHERTGQFQRDLQIFVCYICKKKYGHEKKLRAHLATHDKKLIATVCALCGLRFGTEIELHAHAKQVHKNSVLGGPSSSLPELDDMEDDFRVEDGKMAGKTGSQTRAEGVDMNRNAMGNPADKIRCDYCWKTFKSKWTLNSHVAAHEGRFQFDCGQCGKRFVRKSHFEGHMRSHEAARPYACELCGSTFKQAKHRREHLKRKHPGSQNAVQNLLDSITACVSEESSVDQPKFTLLVPVEFNG